MGMHLLCLLASTEGIKLSALNKGLPAELQPAWSVRLISLPNQEAQVCTILCVGRQYSS
jgi:hypothetical protein